MDNWFKIELLFAKDLNINPLVLDQLEFYRVEYLLDNYEEYVKEQNEKQKHQEKEYNKDGGAIKPQKIKTPNIKVPNIKVPNIKM